MQPLLIYKKNLDGIKLNIYFVSQSTFMNMLKQEHQQDLQHIKQMMERSSRFISLSGLSGIAAGLCALVGSYFANDIINNSQHKSGNRLDNYVYDVANSSSVDIVEFMGNKLFYIAITTFVAAICLSFLFTYLRSKKTNTPLWGITSKRLFINVAIPMLAGGIYLLKLIENGVFGLIAPGCLIFYGLALVNASKYTLGEVKYLGYLQILLGIINLWFVGKGLYFWAVGFGVLHIFYGVIMWYKYERE